MRDNPTDKPVKLPDPNKVVAKPPRLRAISTRNYGKGTPVVTGGPPQAGYLGPGPSYGGTR